MLPAGDLRVGTAGLDSPLLWRNLSKYFFSHNFHCYFISRPNPLAYAQIYDSRPVCYSFQQHLAEVEKMWAYFLAAGGGTVCHDGMPYVLGLSNTIY